LPLEEFNRTGGKSVFFSKCNDFRKSCVYQPSWIGCEEDKAFIGNKYMILDTTDNLNNWSTFGHLGPWILPNMVLGGLFAVNRKEAVFVNGCSNMFGKYGFEETSLVTKLMARYGSYVIPDSIFALHLVDKNSILARDEKDLLFQRTHDIYFNKYLNLSLSEAIEKDGKHFQKIKIKI
jgi:hypothetical protein